jgi:tellurite resistance protein TerC
MDSLPAIFAITTDTYIIYTSNIFAILGLRSLYFVLASMIHRFHFINYVVAVLLILIGIKGAISFVAG